MSADSEPTISRESVCNYVSDAACWGYARFCTIAEIREFDLISSSGVVRLKYGVKATTYAQRSRDLQRYITSFQTNYEEIGIDSGGRGLLDVVDHTRDSDCSVALYPDYHTSLSHLKLEMNEFEVHAIDLVVCRDYHA